MRTISKSQKQQRRGAIIPFVAVLLPLFLIMVAFAIDFGVISVADQQLQNAADAGAVAALTAYQRNPADGDQAALETMNACLLYTSPSPRDLSTSRMPSSA